MISVRFIVLLLIVKGTTVNGKVICNIETKEPIPFVSVYKNNQPFALSDKDGLIDNNLFQCITTDTYLLRCVGYNQRSFQCNFIITRDTLFLEPKQNLLSEVTVLSVDNKNFLKQFKKIDWPNYDAWYYYTEKLYNDKDSLIFQREIIARINDPGGSGGGGILSPAEQTMLVAERKTSYFDNNYYVPEGHKAYESSYIHSIRFYNYYRNYRGFMDKSKLKNYSLVHSRIKDTTIVSFHFIDTTGNVATNWNWGDGTLLSKNDTIVAFECYFLNDTSMRNKKLMLEKAQDLPDYHPVIQLSSAFQVLYLKVNDINIPFEYDGYSKFQILSPNKKGFNTFYRTFNLEFIRIATGSDTPFIAEKTNASGSFEPYPNLPTEHEYFTSNLPELQKKYALYILMEYLRFFKP